MSYQPYTSIQWYETLFYNRRCFFFVYNDNKPHDVKDLTKVPVDLTFLIAQRSQESVGFSWMTALIYHKSPNMILRTAPAEGELSSIFNEKKPAGIVVRFFSEIFTVSFFISTAWPRQQTNSSVSGKEISHLQSLY